MAATIRWTLLMALGIADVQAAGLPARTIELIRHEDYVAAQAGARRDIERVQADAKHRPEVLCAALEQQVRIDAFDAAPIPAAKRTNVERALACRSEHFANVDNAAKVLFLKSRLAAIAWNAGDGKRAGALLGEVAPQLDRYRGQLGATDYAIAAGSLSFAAYAGGDLTGAYMWTHASVMASAGSDTLSRMIRARALINECFRLGRLSRFAEAQVAGREAVTLSGETFGVPSLAHASALFSLGQVQYFAHHFADARATLEAAIDEQRKIGSRAVGDLSASLGMWGNLLRQMGDYENGRLALTEAVAIERSDASTAHVNLSSILSNLSALEGESGHCDDAIVHMREALDIERQRFGAESIGTVAKLDNLGLCELEAGQLAQARADISHSLGIAIKKIGEKNPQLAAEYLDLARVSLAEQQYPEATRQLQQALALLPADLDTLAVTRIQIERNLARSLHAAHADDQAFAHAVAAENVRQRLLRRFAGALDESEGLGLHTVLRGGMDQVLALASAKQDPDWIQSAWQLQIGSRALITQLVTARLKAARGSNDPQTQVLWKNWDDANSAYSTALLSADTGKPDPVDLTARRDALESSEHALIAHIPGLADKLDVSTSLSTLRRQLPARSALIGFAQGRSDPWARDHTSEHDDAQQFYAFSLVPDQAPKLIDLGDAAALSATVRDWTAALRDPGRPLADVDALGEDLRRKIWDPFSLSADLQRVFIVPDGELYRIAWLALPLQNGVLAETGPVPQLLDSERDLIAAPADSLPAPRALLVGAIPAAASSAGACGDPPGMLPGARHELEQLRTLWNETTGAGTIVYLVGNDASKSAVRAAMQQSSIIHFATHAFSEDSECARHLLATRSIRVAGAPAPKTATVAGLLLAADAHAGSTDRNGLLTAPEIAAMRLDGVESVTLSACDTGLGPIRRDEGVFGLARAFRLAGARSVVISLWDVDDAATADLMQEMYRSRWIDHVHAANALATAARAMLAARRAAGKSAHPYYWAAFVVSGDRR